LVAAVVDLEKDKKMLAVAAVAVQEVIVHQVLVHLLYKHHLFQSQKIQVIQ
tara:strand:+ start:47 stop:199 length:153 start_codon:yes stop_codon:yes gene_type:complete